MRRILTLTLVLCGGCASAGGDNLLEDSLWGDLRSLFSGRDTPATVSGPGTSPAYSGNSCSAAYKPGPGQPPGGGRVTTSSDSPNGP
jgi:hypothetical protein